MEKVRWDEWEMAVIRQHYPHGGMKATQPNLPHRSKHAIALAARKLGVEAGKWFGDASPNGAFWSRVHPEPNTGCWLWEGANKKGYGQLRLSDGKLIGAPRYSLILAGVNNDPDKDVCHRCDNPPCVNLEHLFFGTAKENTHDAMRKGRLKNPPPSKKGQGLKDLCHKGHPMAGANLYEMPNGYRACRTCRFEFKRELRARRKAAGLTTRGTTPVLRLECDAP